MANDWQPLTSISASQAALTGGYWEARQTVNRAVTIPAIYHQLARTGRADAWHVHESDPRHDHRIVHKFWDSDLAKWLEAVGYSLMSHPDPNLENLADGVIRPSLTDSFPMAT